MQRLLKVQMNYLRPGFFVYLEFVINALLYCQAQPEYCDIVEVDFGPRNLRGTNRYYEAAYGPNMFEYYFYLKQRPSLWQRWLVKREEKPMVFWKNLHENWGIQCYPHGSHAHLKQCYGKPPSDKVTNWYAHNRQTAHRVIKQHIGVQSRVLECVEQHWNKLFFSSDYVIGIHSRGTDKKNRVGGRKILPEEYFPYIDRLLEQREAKLFLATDDQNHHNAFHRRYPGLLHSIPALRHENNIFLVDEGSPYQKGLEVLVDCLMLSRCQFLLKCSSAVSEFAIFFNPKLHENSLDLQYDCSAFLRG